MTFSDELTAAVPQLRRYARSLARSGEGGDDLLQDTLARAWRKRDRYADDGRPRGVLRWCTIMCRRIFLDGVRRARLDPLALNPAIRRDEVSEEFVNDYGCSTPALQAHVVEVKQTFAIIAGLPEYQRSTLMMLAEGLTYEEMSARMRVPMGTVRSRIFRARSVLNKGEYDEGKRTVTGRDAENKGQDGRGGDLPAVRPVRGGAAAGPPAGGAGAAAARGAAPAVEDVRRPRRDGAGVKAPATPAPKRKPYGKRRVVWSWADVKGRPT